MEAKNLRIGNWVIASGNEDIDGKPFSIETKVISLPNNLEAEYAIGVTAPSEENCDVKGIELNEKWFKRMGLTLGRHATQNEESELHPYIMLNAPDKYMEFYPNEGFWYPLISSAPELSHEKTGVIGLNRIKYVHELQNLFFALTGRELELNEKASV